jgi:hypothetical protein
LDRCLGGCTCASLFIGVLVVGSVVGSGALGSPLPSDAEGTTEHETVVWRMIVCFDLYLQEFR